MIERIALALAVTSIAFSSTWCLAAEPLTDEQVRHLREEGPSAVDRLMARRSELLAKYGNSTQRPEHFETDLNDLNGTIDKVARAKYSHLSGLYWYTEEAAAFAAAKAQQKPLLTLRLLGNLDEEYSCANSRYFRQLLYTHEGIRKALHDKFVLHWKSVRPVPLITVDLQNGMRLQRTITGNSVHYVVLPERDVVDVFPGLYAPDWFLKRLTAAERVAREAMESKDPATTIAVHVKSQREEIARAWKLDVEKYQAVVAEQKQDTDMLAVGRVPTPVPDFWTTVGDFHPELTELGSTADQLVSAESKRIIKVQAEAFPDGPSLANMRLAFAWAKGRDESTLLVYMRKCLRGDLAIDTLQNEYGPRYAALDLLNGHHQVNELNDWIYRHAFGCSPDDPWAGLDEFVQYAALPKNGGYSVEPKKGPK